MASHIQTTALKRPATFCRRGTSFRGYKNAAFSSCLRALVARNRCAATTERGPPCRRWRHRRAGGPERPPYSEDAAFVALVFFVATSAAAARRTSFRGYKNAAFSSCLRVLVANNRCAATTERGPPLCGGQGNAPYLAPWRTLKTSTCTRATRRSVVEQCTLSGARPRNVVWRTSPTPQDNPLQMALS